jgi:hypothetical protein
VQRHDRDELGRRSALGYGDGGNSALQRSVAGRRGSAAETRHAVMAAARDLFLTHRYGATTIGQITAKPA